MRRFFGLGPPRIALQPTPFLRRSPGDAWTTQAGSSTAQTTASPVSASQTWAPVNTVFNQDDWYELVNKIRFLNSMGAEDRPLILEVCDRASTDATAREAIKALMHEFKHGCADAQLSASRLWAILLRNSSAAFIFQSTAVDFLETIEELISSNTTSPVVRNRVISVLGDAVLSNPAHGAFRRLWMTVKPPGAPDQGATYNAHDAILRPTIYHRPPVLPTILDRVNPPTSQPRFPDNRFPRAWESEAPPPSYETATSMVGDVSRRVSYASSYEEIVSDIVSAQRGTTLNSPFETNSLPIIVEPAGSIDVQNENSSRDPPPLQITPLRRKSVTPSSHIHDSPIRENSSALLTPKPTAIRRLPQNRSNLSPPGTSSSGQQSVGPHAGHIRSTKPIYCQTVSYLIEIASTCDRSGALRSLHVFREEMAKLGSVRCLVHALDYKDTLIQTSFDLGVRDHPRFKTALEEDQSALREKVMDVLYCSDDEQVVLSLEDNAAQSLLDIIQLMLDNALLHTRDATSKARRLIGKLAKACDKLPSSLIISGVTQRDEHATFCGGFGDVFKAMYQGKPVALKHMRMFQGTDQRDIRRKFCREALVWQRLRHPYIVPLIGIDTESFPSSLSMVSPWMKNGTVIKYLSRFSDSRARVSAVDGLIREIAQGLAFLHDQNVVHGDLRGSNILVDDSGRACLTDFGLTVLSDATVTQTNHGAGSVRWMAPETLDPGACGVTGFARTPASDIYAFGCVCLELYTGFPPFHDAILHDAPVMFQVMAGFRPPRPPGDLIPDPIWNIMQQCWAHDLAERPSILRIVLELAMYERQLADVAAVDLDIPILSEAHDSASGSVTNEDYGGWVESVIAPFAGFIDVAVNPRNHYVDLQEMADGSDGATLYVARLASADHDLLNLPEDVRRRDENDFCAGHPTFVAIKSIPIVPGGNATLRAVLRERHILSEVQCPNILQMDSLYVDTAEDALWIRMELMTRTLSSIVDLASILTALATLYEKNIAPRNVCSNNILVNSQGVLKLTNLLNATKFSVGSSCLSHFRSDAKALGALVWELAVGQRQSFQNLPAEPEWPPEITSRTPAFRQFIRLCFNPQSTQFAYDQLIEASTKSAFIREACDRAALAQVMVQCPAFEKRLRYQRP
ncbi:kinase-like protein [Favolaschia claudopus]|uniref:Kinase-like protein n=1 Tax=Favolaschia claudopus TaxID=2862362 RepID=A0AAW0BYW3_9AGAR